MASFSEGSSSNSPTPTGSNSQPPNLSSPNFVVSTSIGAQSKGILKKRSRISWTEAHIVRVIENDAVRRRCFHCHVCWSPTTSTGTIARHLAKKHRLTSDTNLISVVTNMSQSFLEPMKVSQVSEKRVDKAVVKYIVRGLLPYSHVESPKFRELMDQLAPGCQLKSKRAVKQSILQMYAVLRKLVIDMIYKTDTNFSLTFDGWSNNGFKGFFVTLHWVCPETAKSKSILLDIIDFLPCGRAGKLSADALFNRLKNFGISNKVLAIVSDRGSDAEAIAKELSNLLKNYHGKEILQTSHMLQCIMHTIQLGFSSTLEIISPTTDRLRATLETIRSSKVLRAVLPKTTTVIHYQDRVPPIADVTTRWKSIFTMYKRAIKERDALSLATSHQSVGSDFTGCLVTSEDWDHMCAIEEWLDTPDEVFTFLSGAKYPTLSIASLAFNCLLNHCNKYADTSIVEPTSLTQKMLHEASQRWLHYLKEYEDCLNSVPARIAMFLDPRVPINATDRDLDVQLVESILETNYHMYAGDVEVPSTNVNLGDTHSRIWRLVGIESRNVISDSRSEIEHFLKLPPASTDKDPLQWWHDNKSSLARMYRMTCDYLAIPASSIPIEEAGVNSARKLASSDRVKLQSYTLKAQLCAHSWMEVLEKSGISMPDDFGEAYESIKVELENLIDDDDIVIDYTLTSKYGRSKLT